MPDDYWSGLADNISATARSVLLPTVEATARGEPPPHSVPAETVETNTGSPVGPAQPPVDSPSKSRPPHLAFLIADSGPDEQQAALATDIVVTLSMTSEDGTPRPDQAPAIGLPAVDGRLRELHPCPSPIIAERIGREPDQIVRLCFLVG